MARDVSSRYLLIAEHGLIGDLHTVALVGTDGTIDCTAAHDSTRRASSRRSSTPTGGDEELCGQVGEGETPGAPVHGCPLRESGAGRRRGARDFVR